jgi:palmitoyl-protein thioesterase
MNKLTLLALLGVASAESPMVEKRHCLASFVWDWSVTGMMTHLNHQHHHLDAHGRHPPIHHHSRGHSHWWNNNMKWGVYHAEDEADFTHNSTATHWSILNQEHHDSPFFEFTPAKDTDTDIEPNAAVPTAVFHGFGDACVNPGMASFTKKIATGTGAYAKCIEVGFPSLGEIINNSEHVAEKSCKEINANPNFQGEFNVIGLSQGGIWARFIVESCDMKGKVRNIATLGGPHMGVDAVPGCLKGAICYVVNGFVKKIIYNSIVQDLIVPAGYFRDVNNMKRYEQKSVFLADMNNEHDKMGYTGLTDMQEHRKRQMSSVNSAMFVMFSEDTVIYPKETAWFQTMDLKGNVMPLNSTEWYNQDLIGLKTLVEANKAHFISFEGNHLNISQDQINNIVVPFLKQ